MKIKIHLKCSFFQNDSIINDVKTLFISHSSTFDYKFILKTIPFTNLLIEPSSN
jgi:hypothetical protein